MQLKTYFAALSQAIQDYLYIIPGFAKFQDWTSAPISSNSREEADFANLESHLFEKKHWNSGQVADEDHIDRATVSGNEYVEWVSSSFFQAQTLVPCGFEFEPPEPLEVGPPGPSSIRVINHRFDMQSDTNIPLIQQSRL